MGLDSPNADIRGKPACVSQLVADNAFYLSPNGDKSRRLLAARLNGGDFSEIGREFVGGERLHIHFDQAHEWTAKVRFGCTASIYNHADCGDDAAMGAHDIDRLLHAAATGHDVFDHNEFLVRQNLKTAAQNELAFVFLYKNMVFA